MLVCSHYDNKIPKIRGLQQRKLIFSELWRLEVPDQGLISDENSLLGVEMATFPLCPHTVEKKQSLVSLLLYKDPSPITSVPIPWSNLTISLKALFPIQS